MFESLINDLIITGLTALITWLITTQVHWIRFGPLRGHPTPSPDGKQVAFSGNDQIVLAGNGVLRQIPSRKEYGPIWSLDSRYLAFTAQSGGRWQVYVMNPQTTAMAVVLEHRSSAKEKPIGWNVDGSLGISLGGAVLYVPREEIWKRLGELEKS